MTSLFVSEMFYSIQGEGRYAGTPSIFLRLQHCNLLCQWPCDTIEVWRNGSTFENSDLQRHFKKKQWDQLLTSGQAHLVVTGGEPLLQKESLVEFLLACEGWTVEVETNATIFPSTKLDALIDHYNLSPKLSNSGMPKAKRYNSDVIEYFAPRSNSDFKFVVTQENDMEEIMADFVTPFSIQNDHVFLMPASTSRKELERSSPWVIEMCKSMGFRYSPRLQLMVYDQKTGV